MNIFKKFGFGLLWLIFKLISLTFLAFAIIAVPVRVIVSYLIITYMIMILINFFVTFEGWTWFEIKFHLVAVGIPVLALFSDTIENNDNDEELINACYEYLLKKGKIKK